MDGEEATERKKNPREGVNVLNALTFAWMLKIFWIGFKRDLEIEDLPRPLQEHKSSNLGDKLSMAWEKQLKSFDQQAKKNIKNNKHYRKTPSLTRAMFSAFGAKIALYGVLLFAMEIIFMILQPLALGRLLRYYSTNPTTKTEAYVSAAVVIMCPILYTSFAHPSSMAMLHLGMKIRIACCSLIYRKALKLSITALGKTTTGQAVNLISNDVNRFDTSIVLCHYLWIGPVQTGIITYLMYQEVNLAAVIGIIFLLMFIPLQGWLGKQSGKLRMKTALATDERIRLTNEIITGIQAIKMYAWEYPFGKLIEMVRKREIKVIRSMSYIKGIEISFMVFTTRTALFLTILAYILLDEKNQINVEKVFIVTAFYSVLQRTMTDFFPLGITLWAETAVSIKRLQNFLMYNEVSVNKIRNSDNKESTVTMAHNKSVDGNISEEVKGSVILKNVHSKWSHDDKVYALSNIDMNVKPGELVVVVGQVGSGKSSLLNIILKELNIYEGTMHIDGDIAYTSQEPWLFAESIRTNILFGKKMDHRKYNQVIEVCQLKRDFSLFPYGDKTIVGERGISLSGGQRARINLARAVYADASIYLFDDPLSAVDTHVGKHIFEQCIEEHLSGKTRILVTHQIQFLKKVEKIIVMKNGKIESKGTYKELIDSGVNFGILLEQPIEEVTDSSINSSKNISRHTSITSLSSQMTDEDSTSQKKPSEFAEMKTKGHIRKNVYSSYITAGGNWCNIVILFFLCIGTQIAATSTDYFVAFWINMEEKDLKNENLNKTISTNNGPGISSTEISLVCNYKRMFDTTVCVYIFSALIATTIIITLTRSFSFYAYCMKSSQKLHDRMFRSISRATMRFFSTNPSGRILNRFSKDMGTIDESLPMSSIDVIQIGLSLIGILVIVGVANPWLMIPTAVIGIIFYFIRIIFIRTSRSVKRLEGITRSPVFNHLNATLSGLVTIRSFNAESILTNEFDHHQDLHSSAWYMFIASSRTFSLWLDVFCLIYITLVILSLLILPNSSIEGANVGLVITQTIGLTGMFQWGMRQTAELENQITSVERVLEYTNLESEPPLESILKEKPKDDWPENGEIEFKEVYLFYNPEEPPILKNLNFVIKSKEKIGIVGRTGAGKSSIISALFRLAKIEGKIIIDGIDAGEIGLHDLRSKISIIPQEPFLFSGTLRQNLDPFDLYSDHVLWAALEDVELKEMNLLQHINEGGSNLSVGERQLVCLARAIVRNNKILVLDEATANVDLRTDEFIQKAIRNKFAECTVITIAHRLNTVMDNDRILVMDGGRAVEFDHPYVLLQNETGYLSGMVKQTNKLMENTFKTVAKQNYDLHYTITSL